MPATMRQAMRVVVENPEIFCHMTLSEYLKFCCTGQLPTRIAQIFKTESMLRDILCAADIVGALEPLAATRPGVCDPVIHFQRNLSAPPATIVDGVTIPGEEGVISFCAPINRALVIELSRLTPLNDLASSQPVAQPIYKKVNLGFGEWCLPFEPASVAGSFVNVEHIVVPPGGGFSIYAQNFFTTGPAIYSYEARMWASC